MALIYIPALLASAAEGQAAVVDCDDYCPHPMPESLGIDLYEEPYEEEE